MSTTTRARRMFQVAIATAAAALALSAAPAHAQPAPAVNADQLLVNVRTGLCADVPGFGPGTIDGPVNQWYCNPGPGDNQLWRLLPYPDGTYAIQNVKDGYCMDVPAFGAVPATTKISQYHCVLGPSDNQMFSLEWVGNGWRFHHVKDPALCLDVDGLNGSGGPDARLTLWHCSLTDDHVWSLS
ncbi:RICIN domain-containing protein [Actinosynnema sp. CS-041913]|uniref:RICIN domain-containing protein n=1 Tax=Actinosynnema sp. CS-041913 TaxID=3239917 RepID=UPI003D8D5769